MLFATARRLKWSTSRLWIFHERLKRASLRGLSLVCVFVCFFDCLFGCLFGKSVKKGPGEQGRQGKVGEPGREGKVALVVCLGRGRPGETSSRGNKASRNLPASLRLPATDCDCLRQEQPRKTPIPGVEK